jgi:UDP-glucose 4-epimerase
LDLVAQLNQHLGTKVEPVFEPRRIGDVRESLADISEARRALGYEPQVTFEEGLRRAIAYYRETAGKK